MSYRILVVEDDPAARDALRALLELDGLAVAAVGSAEEALASFREESFHLALVDQELPGRSGVELAGVLTEAAPLTGVVLMTGHGSTSAAVRAMKLGALDYVAKPLDAGKLRRVIAEHLEGRPHWVPNRLRERGGDVVEFDGMVARSPSMKRVFERVALAAGTAATVLVLGESGTGKELVARSIHRRSGRTGEFVPVNTGAIPRELVASELFGHERGAFTGAVASKEGKFELAEKGTLFLDEIDTMDDRTQVHLLRVLETMRLSRVGGRRERAIDVRVVAATNADLTRAAARGEFREDLFYRLAIVTVELPPLRERKEDIAPLAVSFLEAFARRYGRAIPRPSPELLARLEAHEWPGNVRELRNAVEQAAILCAGRVLGPEHLPPSLRPAREDEGSAGVLRIPVNTPMRDVEREVIRATLAANGGNKNRTARILRISRRALYNKLAKYGLSSAPAPRAEAPSLRALADGGESIPRG